MNHTFTETQLAAIKQVALAAFLDDIGADAFMSMNVDGLVHFRERHALSQEAMNVAWQALQSWSVQRHERAFKAIGDAWGMAHA